MLVKAMRHGGDAVLAIDAELVELNALLTALVTATAPQLLVLHGIGVHTASLLLVSAGDNPQRLRSEASWAHLCGVSPIQASSGKTTRHRLNRSGDRQANHALLTIPRPEPRGELVLARPGRGERLRAQQSDWVECDEVIPTVGVDRGGDDVAAVGAGVEGGSENGGEPAGGDVRPRRPCRQQRGGRAVTAGVRTADEVGPWQGDRRLRC
jgi:hypothetical protein